MWKRLTAMSRDEVRTRVRQAISKRMDLAFYRAGLGSPPRLLSPDPSSEAKFFFGASDVQNRAALLRAHLPQAVDAIVRDADEVCRHEFRLLGCEKMNLGQEIDWHLSEGKRDHRLKPWYKVNFLDFDSVGDHKLVWELNRHQHLVTLAKAWSLTLNPVYVRELVAQWCSWQKANPYPLGINWASTLEAAFRSISWLWVRNLLGECAELPANFQRDLLLALQLHGRHIERYLSTYFSPNTHLLGEAVALFFIGTSCPQIAASQRWRELGWRIILGECERQVRPDGVHFEQSLYYHVYALDFFLHARVLAAENGVAIPVRFDDVLKKMLDFIQELSAAGAVEGFGDDDGGRVFNPRRNRAECMTDPLAIGAAVFGRQYASASLTEESIWLAGDKALRPLDKQAAVTGAPSKAFPASGIYLMNDCEPFPQQLMIDAGPQGSGSCGHGHADALSVRLSLQGQRFLIDPGTFCYVSAGEERNQFRGTGGHNTLRIDRADQARPEGPFAWSSSPNTTAEAWVNGETFDFFVGTHDGYKRLPEPVLHRRFIFHVKGGLWLVRDVAQGRGTHLLESFWHFSPDVEITKTRGAFIARVSATDDGGIQAPSLALFLDSNSAWTADVNEDHVSAAYGAKQFAPVLRFSANASVPEDCGILLLAGAEQREIGNFASVGHDAASEVRGYRYQTSQATEFIFFAEGLAPWICGCWKSDAKLLYCKFEGRLLAHVIMVNGTFGECGGQPFISHPNRLQSFEWVKGSAIKHSDSSEAFVMKDVMLTDSGILDSVL